MRPRRAPRLEERRASQFAAELHERARVWMPSWGLVEGERDFGRALLMIAARFSSEVGERLDRAGEKMRGGFLDWLAVRGEAARPARLPVVFKLADTAAVRDAVLASAPVQMQLDVGGTSVVVETETDVRLVPGGLELVVGVDAEADAFYLPPPGLTSLKPVERLPTQWQLKSYAATGSTALQLDPKLGLDEKNMLVEADTNQYRIVKVSEDVVTIDPPLTQALPRKTIVRKVTAFAPFDRRARNRQEHVLYFGHMELLDIGAAATIEIVGAKSLGEGVTWQYWGKHDDKDEATWQRLVPADEKKQQPDSFALEKPKGSIVPTKIDGKESRWIRAFRATVDSTATPFVVGELSIRVNCKHEKVSCPPTEDTASPVAEAMANTAPLMIDARFYPLGKEPRQFDAFYLGSAEAFSKKGAEVQLCFEMADLTFEALACLRTGPAAHSVLAGVARDGQLQILGFDASTGRLARYNSRESLRPPLPGWNGTVVPGAPVTLDPSPAFRSAMWAIDLPGLQEVCIAVTARGAVWVWHEVETAPRSSGWQKTLGAVGPVSDSEAEIKGLVYLADGSLGQLFALRESRLFVCDLAAAAASPSPEWRMLETKDGGATIALTQIVPICIQGSPQYSGSIAEGLVGVGANEALYAITFAGAPLGATCIKLLDDVAPDMAPAAIRGIDSMLVAVAVGKKQADRKLLGFRSTPTTFTTQDLESVPFNKSRVVGHSIDVNVSGGQVTFAVCLQVDASSAVAFWSPFDPSVPSALFTTIIPAAIGPAAGAPTLLPNHVVVPVLSSQVLVAGFDPGRRLTLDMPSPLRTSVITETQADRLQPGDLLAIPVDDNGATKYRPEVVAGSGYQRGSQTLHEFNLDSISEPLFVYRASTLPFSATVGAVLDELTLDASDEGTRVNTLLLITTDQSTDLYRVIAFDEGTKIAELDRPIDVADPTAPPTTVIYQVPEPTGARHVPLLRLDPATTGNWDAALLDSTALVFPGNPPRHQHGIAFDVDSNRRPILVSLATHFTPPSPAKFVVDTAVTDWSAQLGDTSSNPDLSWEYWNGTGWWRLDLHNDETLDLKRSGAITFAVPADLRPTDWSGRTNHWIRARLVGGDYGREKVTVSPSGTVERSTQDIRAPSVAKLHIAYQICERVLPTFVLTKDSGSARDQSDANRTGGAIVEAFVPLAVALGRLSGAMTTPAGAEKSSYDCGCPSAAAGNAGGANPVTTVAGGAAPTTSGRALFLGLKAALSGAPVNVLLLVDEARHDRFAPMKVEALVGNRFVPLVVSDTTRALGESNVLSMSFALPPTPRDLFGETMTWLRLTPAPGAPANEWMPTVRGAYLNAAWASAAETLTRELVGSSDGAPNLTLFLARPPLLSDKLDPRDTLELRVREPLGEEELAELRKEDDKRVLSAVENLPGDWVLWKRVIDPGDEPATERVYALDEATGEIRFGDGQHGAIPPVGRDSIVAFSYRRTEVGAPGSAGVPANSIAPRTALNLVSPVEGVEAVVAADQAAGGAPPEVAERVLRFGAARLRHRNRAVTADDFEDLALQSSPDIVQARCFPHSGFVRLVVVMRGNNPLPNAAQVRELRRLLLAASPALLSLPQALRIAGPSVRRLRIDLRLRVASLDHAGAVARWAGERITAFFDTATGGAEHVGWALGEGPSEAYIALALADVPRLDSIADVKLRELAADDAERPWAGAVKPTELVMLADDPVRVEFEPVEVMA